jgi:MFS family permease
VAESIRKSDANAASAPEARYASGWGGHRGGDAPSLLQIHKTFSALAIPAYRLLWLSMMFSFLGMQMQMVARGVLAYQIGGTNSAIAIVSLGWGLPMLVFGLIGGTIADRMQRHKLMSISQLGTAAVALAAAILVQTGEMNLWYLFLSGVAQGTIFAFSGPARQAFIPEIVGEKQLLNAIALNSAVMNLTRIVGPSIAGALVAISWVDIQGVFMIQAVMNVVAAVMLIAMPLAMKHLADDDVPEDVRPASPWMRRRDRGTVVSELVAGLRYVVASPILLTLLLMGLVPSLLGMSYQSFLPVFAKDVFGDGINRNSEGLGVMMTVTGVGALIGSLVVASMQDYPRRAMLQLFGGLGFGLGIAMFAISGNLILALAGLLVIGFMASFFQALNSTMVMSASDPEYYGRVMSVNMLTFALMPIGTLPVGYVADLIGTVSLGPIDLIGIQAAHLGAGLIIAVFILLVTVKNPAYRRLEQDDLKRFAAVAVERVSNKDGSSWQQLRSAFREERGSTLAASFNEAEPSRPGAPSAGR